MSNVQATINVVLCEMFDKVHNQKNLIRCHAERKMKCETVTTSITTYTTYLITLSTILLDGYCSMLFVFLYEVRRTEKKRFMFRMKKSLQRPGPPSQSRSHLLSTFTTTPIPFSLSLSLSKIPRIVRTYSLIH